MKIFNIYDVLLLLIALSISFWFYFCSGIFATDLPSDFSDGNILTASELNNWKEERDGDILPISQYTKNFITASANLGSATYKFKDTYLSGTLYVPKHSTNSGALTLEPASGSNLNVSLGTTGDFAVNTNQLYVDTSAGNVGIGTTAPAAKLHIKDATAATYAVMRLSGTSRGGEIDFYDGTTAGAAIVGGTSASKDMYFYTGGISSIAMTIKDAGNVGIGTTAPAAPLHVRKTSAGELLTLQMDGAWGASLNSIKWRDNTAGGSINSAIGTRYDADGGMVNMDFHSFYNGGFKTESDVIMTLLGNGKLGIGTTAPDKALEVNHATGACLRLTYNDSNGSAANYTDYSVSSGGDLTINPSGKDTTINGNLVVTGNISGSIKDYGSSNHNVKMKVVEIGVWNMDSDAYKSEIKLWTEEVDNTSKIMAVNVMIIGDSDTYSTHPLTNGGYCTISYYSVGVNYYTYIQLNRDSSGYFDNTNFNDTSYNRGFITVWYTD